MKQSESIGKLSLALSKLQGEIQNVFKDRKGYNYSYADLASILDLCRPLCAKHELAFTQLGVSSKIDPNRVGVRTMLSHSSGEWIASTLYMPVHAGKGMTGAQAAGSVITYIRRYALAAILGVAQTDNDAAAIQEPMEATKPKDSQEQIENKLHLQLGALTNLMGLIEEHKLHSKIPGWLEHFKVGKMEDLTAEDIRKISKTIRENANGTKV